MPVSSPKLWNKQKVGKVEWLPRRRMFVQLLHYNAMTAKSAITPLRRIVVTTRIVSSLVNFVRVARNTPRIAKPSSFVEVRFRLTP